MPDVTVHNETPDNLNVAFRFVAPANWTNSLTPGNSWTTHLSSTPYTVEVRLDHGEENRFSAENSWAIAGDVTGGWFAGATSVVLGAFSLGGGIVAGGTGLAVATPHATCDGSWGKIPFSNKVYAVRFDENSGYSLWDLDGNVRL
ncbi:hypothetical protein GALMADRAFT_213631 [Galerina marginata CBS 339.88]|uniref:Uncharacterized protein n=1 Tax=Galerina marginata (strain CBS 339.88) TaxID=685588 RepID=A0A067SVN9_GALM3|nr:hypothetical protein GALMADRAFT_213631 [Galerina marginata CBS 339.88]